MATMAGTMMLSFTGCEQPRKAPASAEAKVEDRTQQVRKLAQSVLGSEAEVLAQGNLSGNGVEQVLVVDGGGKAGDALDAGKRSAILITRAVVLEKSGRRWIEALRCDEHLENPKGFLEGTPIAPVTGWWFEYRRDVRGGLELLFTPAGVEKDEKGPLSPSIVVRWNRRAKRFQALDRSHKRFLGEVPTLEIPRSVLR